MLITKEILDTVIGSFTKKDTVIGRREYTKIEDKLVTYKWNILHNKDSSL